MCNMIITNVTYCLEGLGASLVAQTVKTAAQENWVQSLGWEDALEKGMATRSSILVWRIPWTEKSLTGYSPWGRNELDMTKR